MTKIYTKINCEQILLLVSLVRIVGGSSLVAGNKVVSFIPGSSLDKTETYGEILSLLEDSEDFYIRKANVRDISEYKYLQKMSQK